MICYASLETTANMFEGCTNLREVIFVNGVRSLGYGTFYGCDNLETVYVGPYVEEVSDDAFAGCSNFDLSKCITDPALMPDLDALLAAVKSDPIPEPTPAPTAAPAMPVGEAGTPYVGTWQAVTLEMEGESYNVVEMGLEMNFTLYADGTAESYDGEIYESGTWTIENGAIIIGDGIEGMVPMSVADDGTLVMEEDGIKLIFAKADAASIESEVPMIDTEPIASVGSAGVAYIGTWRADTLEMDGDVYSVADMGLEMTITLNADGTAESYDGETIETGTWSLENGLLILDGIAMLPNEEEQLIMEEDGMKLVFVKSDAASATEEEGFTGVWYGCYMVTGAMDGDPRELFEITLTINEDGTANLAYPTDEFWHWTENEDGSLLMVKDSDNTEMPLFMLDENFICFGSTDGDGNAFGSYIIFGRDAEAVWTPDMLAQIDVSTETAASVDTSAAMNDRMEIKYICTSADVEGLTMQPSMLGGEYSLTFHANGTVDFVMVGTPINGLPWTLDGDSILIDYYGTIMEATQTEEGFDLNYFDTMLLHLLPEA